jgi:hypothetical protein
MHDKETMLQEYTRGGHWQQHSERSIAGIGTPGPALHNMTNKQVKFTDLFKAEFPLSCMCRILVPVGLRREKYGVDKYYVDRKCKFCWLYRLSYLSLQKITPEQRGNRGDEEKV